MTKTQSQSQLQDIVDAARGRVYDAECALHAARQSGVDAWVKAASAKLHTALVALAVDEIMVTLEPSVWDV